MTKFKNQAMEMIRQEYNLQSMWGTPVYDINDLPAIKNSLKNIIMTSDDISIIADAKHAINNI